MACCPKCGNSKLKRRKGWLRCKHCGPISGPAKWLTAEDLQKLLEQTNEN